MKLIPSFVTWDNTKWLAQKSTPYVAGAGLGLTVIGTMPFCNRNTNIAKTEARIAAELAEMEDLTPMQHQAAFATLYGQPEIERFERLAAKTHRQFDSIFKRIEAGTCNGQVIESSQSAAKTRCSFDVSRKRYSFTTWDHDYRLDFRWGYEQRTDLEIDCDDGWVSFYMRESGWSRPLTYTVNLGPDAMADDYPSFIRGGIATFCFDPTEQEG